MKHYLLGVVICVASIFLNSQQTLAAEAATLPVKPARPSAIVPSKMNINIVDAKTLAQKIPELGKRRANAIIKYRGKHGRFASISDLGNVKGISKRFYKSHQEQLAQLLRVG